MDRMTKQSHRPRAWHGLWIAAPIFLLMAVLQPQPAFGQDATWAEDIAPILYESCVGCHQPEGIGPMSLLDYETARLYAPLIKVKVETRQMPPWHVDQDVGIQEFKNDVSLSAEEIQRVVQWVDAGAPQGDMSHAPPVPEIPSGDEWRLATQFGPPDLIIKSSPFDVPASGLDNWWPHQVEVEGLDGPRWVMANETKPSMLGKGVVHHANSSLITEDGRGGFSNYGIGKPFDIFPEDTGRLIAPGNSLSFNIHYYPNGVAIEDDVVEIGLWFYPEGQDPRFATEGDVSWSSQRQLGSAEGRGRGLTVQQVVLPPHGRAVTQGFHVLQENTRLHSCRGHMHLRGASQSMEAIFPDGHLEILCKVNWNGEWHINYLFEDHVMPLLPKGTVLVLTAWYDNTAANPVNPDPDQWVIFGRRSADEMSHMWIGTSYLSDEDFEYLKAQREQRIARLEEEQGGG